MGFNLSAFAGGAAAGLTEKFEEERKIAQAAVVGRISRAAEINKRKLKETTELRSSLEEQLADIEQVVGPDETLQKAFLTSPTAYATYKEQKLKGEPLDPYKFITINKDKLFAGSSKDFIAKLTQEAAAPAMPTAEAKPTSFFAPSAERMKGYAESAAMSAGMTMEDVQRAEAYTGLKKPESVATMNLQTLVKDKKPKTVEEEAASAKMAMLNAQRTAGVDSPEYKAAQVRLTEANSYIADARTTLASEVDDLLKKRVKSNNPTEIAALTVEIERYQKEIKNHNAALKPDKTDEEKKKTYSAIKTSVQDFVNTRMKADEGASWRKYVDYKTYNLPDGSTYTSATKKAEMPLEEQQKMFATEKALAQQALKSNGYLTSSGVPLYKEVGEVMNNFGISIGQAAPRAFATVQEAEAARLPKGTKITIGGRPAEVR